MNFTVQRNEIYEKQYREILDVETHHDHEIIIDSNGTLRWNESPEINNILTRISLNDITRLMMELGYDKNSEFYRKLYRCIGYSLSGYWEIFYWNVNNENADDYIPNSVP